MAKAPAKTEAAAPAAAPTVEAAAAAPTAPAVAGGESGAGPTAEPPPYHEGERIIPAAENAALMKQLEPAVGDAPAAASRTVRARVLTFCALGAPDDVIEIDTDQIALVGDVIDTDPAAVAYAESLKG